jgi:hypothetical protein
MFRIHSPQPESRRNIRLVPSAGRATNFSLTSYCAAESLGVRPPGAHCASPSHRASLLGRAVKWRGNGQKSDGIPLNGAVPARPFANTRRTPNPAFGGSARSARLGPSRRRRGSRRYGTPRAGAHRRCIPAHRDERKLRLSAAGAPARHRGSAP